ncbi:DUF2589 domain-containing protein [Streptomyces sp. NPDC018026]|uniref:DUF2589 domain-containing protein n=1 Tax=Streptomyces sp. NPDC018026 TaxID=3365031 RepID=UPI003799C0C0
MSDDDVPVSALLGAAYEAVVHGQGLAAREAIELVKDLGFDKYGNAKPFCFAYQRTEATEAGPQVRTVHATVPLLSLVNPPVISIDSAKINMSLHLTSQDIRTGPADGPAASSAAAATTPKLKGRIVHQGDKNAVLTIESTLKQRDLMASSRLSQLLEAAVSDRDSVWYQVLDLAEAFRKAATALIDTVAQDGSKGKGVGVREWLQLLWELKETVTDAVSAFRDGLPEKIPPLHQRWNTQCRKLTWIDRHTEPETITQLRRAFIAAARDVWDALPARAQVAEFGPPTVEQLRDRFKAARAALAAAVPSLTDLLGKLEQLEGAVAQGCIAHQYKQPEAVTATLDRYNKTAEATREMWNPSAQSPESRDTQDELAAAAERVWDALGPRKVPVDFRASSRMSIKEIEECTRLLGELDRQAEPLREEMLRRRMNKKDPCDRMQMACTQAYQAWDKGKEALQLGKRIPDSSMKGVIEKLETFNNLIRYGNYSVPSYDPDRWNPAARAWNRAALQIWGHLIDTRTHPVTELAYVESRS